LVARAPNDLAVTDSGGTVGAAYTHGADADGPAGVDLARFPVVGRASHQSLIRAVAPERLDLARPTVAFSPVSNEYGVFYWVENNRRVQLRVARIAGDRVSGDSLVATSDRSPSPASAVWADTEYGIAWVDTRAGQLSVWFQRLDSSASPVGEPVAIIPDAAVPRSPSLVWTGDTYGMVYVERDGPADQVYFVSGPLGCPVVR
jgi:hypothetical protein